MKRVLHSKLLHFLLLGGLLHGLLGLLPQPAPTLRLSSGEVQRLYNSWQRESGRAPTASEWQASLQRRSDEEVLLFEALRLELELHDPVARQRLLQDWRFANPDAAGDEAAQLAAARAIGLPEQDEVVRRRLIQRMEQQLAGGLAVDEAGLTAFIAAHPERYAGVSRTHFEQRWLGHASAEQAAHALAALRAGQAPAHTQAWPYGEGEMQLAGAEVAQRFGPDFEAALRPLPLGSWQGPLSSAYGLHLVRVLARPPALEINPASVRAQAAYAYLNTGQDAAVLARLRALRKRYTVLIAPRPGATS